MKKTRSVLLGLLLLAAPAAKAQFIYTTNGGVITLAQYTGAGGAVVISNFVNNIGTGAFAQAGISSVTIPASVAGIGDYAFSGCSNLASVTISNGVASIGSNAFSWTGLTSVTIPDSVTSIGGYAFAFCSNLASATIPLSVTNFGDYAFYECSGLAGATIPGSLTNMYDQFYGCSNLQSVTIDNGVASVPTDEFYGLTNLASVTIPDSVTSIASAAFAWTGLTSVTIPDSVTSIGGYAFAFCSNLVSVTIPLSVTNFGDYAFYECSDLASATIPGSLTNMHDQFYGCTNLQSATIDNGVTSVAADEFYGLTNLTSVTIPDSVTSIASNAFAWTGLTSVTIPFGVTGIGVSAFGSCSSLTGVTIPGSVTSIGSNAFAWTGLSNVTIPAGLTSIGVAAFAGCSSLVSVTIPLSVTNFGDYAFYECSDLASATIPGSLTNIHDQFFGCSNLQTVTIDNGVTSLAADEFYGCSNLTRVTIAGSVTNIATEAFTFCVGLKTVLFEGNAPKLGSYVFTGDSKAKVYYWSGATGWSSSLGGLSVTAVTAPSITTQPQSFGGLLGTNVTLRVVAKGTSPLSYQWQFDGTNIPAATTNTCAIQNLQLANSGSYQVVITNNYDETVTSGVAIVSALANVTAPSIVSLPASVSVVLGSNTTIQVAAAGTAPLSFEWLFDNKKLANGSHVSGVTTSNLTLESATAGDAGSYKVIVSNLYNSLTSAVATVTVLVPPAITTQPVSEHPSLGGIATFSVKTSSKGVTYQWLFDNGPLSDNANISGSASNTLRINLVNSNDVGSYSVVLSNTAAHIESDTVELTLTKETSKPSVTIAFPKANSRTNAAPGALLLMSGTASDDVRVLNVAYWVTNVNNGVVTISNSLAVLSAGIGSASNWTIQTPLLPGTNILAVRSANYAGLASPAVSAQFFYRVATPFAWVINGMGRLAGAASAKGDPAPSNGALLYVGEGYTLTNFPAANWWLTNWLTNGAVAGTNTTLNFIMESNLIVTANFATNLFVGASARYDGIFYPSPAQATVTNSGLIYNLQLRTNGTYTGKIYLAGTDYSLNGGFDRAGDATETIDRTTVEGGNLTLQLNIPWWSAPRQITGSVKGTNVGGWISTNLTLYAAATNMSNPSNFTALLPQDANVPDAPPGYGYALMTNIAGMIHSGGALSDGASFSSVVEPINDLDAFPVYASLYSGQGLLLGQLSLDTTNNTTPAGSLIWFKPAQSGVLYPNEFTANLDVLGSPWTNSPSALAAFTNEATLTAVFFAGSAGVDTNLVQLTSTNTLRLLSTTGNTGPENFVSGKINPADGLMTLTFTNTSGKKVTAYGTILQNTNQGGGFLLTPTNAATISLEP